MRAEDIAIGTVIGGYKIESILGKGGMGVVYLGHELSLNRKVAIKVLSQKLSSDKEFIERFKREARVIAALEHPNIVRILSYGEEEGLHYFAMEYIRGKDLGEILKEKSSIPLTDALAITSQAASALAEAGSRGVVHRDLKPSNIMLDEKGRVRITDFGVAHLEESDNFKLTRTGWFLGTPEFASPEQASGAPLDVRSDIYSLGAVLYWMLAGRPPITADSPQAVLIKIATEPLPPIQKVNPSVPDVVRRLIEKMTAKDPSQRFQKPEDVVSAVDDCTRSMKAASYTPGRKVQEGGGKDSSFYVKAIGGVMGIALIIFLIVYVGDALLRRKEPPKVSPTREETIAVTPPVSSPVPPGPTEPSPSFSKEMRESNERREAENKPMPFVPPSQTQRPVVSKVMEKPVERPTEPSVKAGGAKKTDVASATAVPRPDLDRPAPPVSQTQFPVVSKVVEKPAERPSEPAVKAGEAKKADAASATAAPRPELDRPGVEKSSERSKGMRPAAPEGKQETPEKIAVLKKEPEFRKIPNVLIIVSGDESIAPLFRAHLESIIMRSGLTVTPVTEIPRLREKVQIGQLPITYSVMKEVVPPGKTDILLLAQIQKAGSMMLQYYGRTQELVTATFTVQVLDMTTGISVEAPATGSAKFTSLNMNENIRDAVNSSANHLGGGIKRYWEEKAAGSRKGG